MIRMCCLFEDMQMGNQFGGTLFFKKWGFNIEPFHYRTAVWSNDLRILYLNGDNAKI